MIDETAWQINKAVMITYSLSVMIEEAAWQRNKAGLLTCCWSWDSETGKETKQCHSLPVGHVMRLPDKEIKQWCHSLTLPVGHRMRLPGKEIKQGYSLAVGQ